MYKDLSIVLSAFSSIIGENHLITDNEELERYGTATFKTNKNILAVLRPGCREEVQACVKIANTYHIPLYPISTGLNIGYGSRVPTADNCIILELKRMKKIVDFNKELAYITLEPGVTQGELYTFLQEQNSGLWMDATGAFSTHSIIGNIAERGFGHTPYADHFAYVGGMEVVLPEGDVIHTGFGRFGNAKAAGIYRWGVGPYIDGIFTQSNFGIITQVTLWLMKAPEYFQSFYFSVTNDNELENVIELLKPLRLEGVIDSAMHIGNDYKVFSSIQRFPWEKADGKTALSKTLLNEFAESWDFGAWNASGALYGTKEEVAYARKRIKKQLKGKVKKLRFIDERTLKLAETLKKPLQWLTGTNFTEMLKIIKPVFGMTKGIPTDAIMASSYWRKRGDIPKNMDPDNDGCGLLWCAPVAPTNGKYAMEMWKITQETLLKYGFEPAVSITLITERAMDCIISITYDRTIEGEDEKAQACHDELLGKLTDAGYYPYRLGIQSMQGLPMAEEAYTSFMQKLKSSLDPKQILSPGRYSPETT